MGKQPDEQVSARRVIKRYSNRKLYDTKDSRYVTLLQIAEMVRQGEDVQIIDNTTKEDKTDVTLALAISEELKARPKSVPLATLRQLIQARGERLLTTLREGPIGRLMPTGDEHAHGEEQESGGAKPVEAMEEDGEREAPADSQAGGETEAGKHEEKRQEKKDLLGLAELVASSRHTLDQWQHAIDERIRTVLPNFGMFREVQREIRHLKRRMDRVEQALGLDTLEKIPESERAPAPSDRPDEPAEGGTTEPPADKTDPPAE